MMNFRLFFIPVCLLALSSSARASTKTAYPKTCKPFRLDQPAGSMERIPVHDQQDLGICGAYSAADMIDAWRFSHGDTRYSWFTSPLEAAVDGSKKYKQSVLLGHDGVYAFPFEGVDECVVVNYIAKSGSCDSQAIEKKLGPANYDTVLPWYKSYLMLAKSPNEACTSDGNACQTPTPISIENAVTISSPLLYFQAITTEACEAGERIPISIPGCKESDINGPGQFEEVMSKHFDTLLDKAQPLTIGYCSGLLEEGRGFRGLVTAMHGNPPRKRRLCRGYDDQDEDDDGGHSSLVMGRRWNGKKCQILIKNSWGTDDDDYSDDWKTEDGKIWVDQDDLEQNVFDVSYIQ